MRGNLGGVDRGVRFVAGLILLLLFFTVEGDVRYVGLLGLPLLITAAAGWCPAYLPFRLSTRKKG